ncbi:MAG: hypothetical protein IKD07_03160, partial [Clostridia bacterium]|nr:hypothetical protein [Clostridia bacterium]
MKRIFTLFVLLALCVLLTACNGTQQPSQTEDQSTSESPSSPTQPQKPVTPSGLPAFLPTAPKELTEVLRYEYGSDGFYIIKEYYDEKGNRLEEHYYTVDGELGILDCKIAAYNTVDEAGNLIRSKGHYIANPYYALRETVLTMEAIAHEQFDYRVLDEDGNVTLYIKETKNASGDVTLEEYFTKGGRFIRAEEYDYREDGTLHAYRGKNARGELIYETLCNENGDFISCLKYNEEGRPTAKIYAEYHENGRIKTYKIAAVYTDGTEDEAHTVTEFYDDGRIQRHNGKNYNYDENGALKNIFAVLNQRTFDKNGYLLSYSGSETGEYLSDVNVNYSYDAYGRLTSCVTKNPKTLVQTKIEYEYAEDGSVTVRHTNRYGIVNNIIYTDVKGRIVQTEIHSNTGRTSHQTLEYDPYGNVIKICDYEKDVLKADHFYEYNEHGDLVKSESKTYSSHGISTTAEEYEYFENGYLKCQISSRNGERTYMKQYQEDGGYIYTEYSSLEKGKKHIEKTYDKYGNTIKSVTFARAGQDYDLIAIYEYYPDDSEKKRMIYYDDLLQFGEEYDEDENIIVEYKRDENGVIVKNVYKEGNFYFPIRKEVYHDGVYAGSVVWEYFSFGSNVKTKTEYDANGEKVYYIEYDEEAFTEPNKEEFYENGVLISYVYQTYVMAGDLYRVETFEELKDGTVTRMVYEYDETGKTIRHTTFVNGEQVSDTAYIYPSHYRIVISYDMNGNVIERQEFRSGSLEVIYRYEYHSNGNVKQMTEWEEVSERETGKNVEFMNEKKIYNENGDILWEESYDYYFPAYFKKCSYVYVSDGKLDYVDDACIREDDEKLLGTGRNTVLFRADSTIQIRWTGEVQWCI